MQLTVTELTERKKEYTEKYVEIMSNPAHEDFKKIHDAFIDSIIELMLKDTNDTRKKVSNSGT